MFRVKDEVVYPGHGVAVIEEAVTRFFGAEETIFFKLSFKYKNMSILVPRERLEKCGVRFISKREDVEEALRELEFELSDEEEWKELAPLGWSKRQRGYQTRLDTGDLKEIARTYRILKRRAAQENLSFGEKGILLAAEDLLSQEVMEVTKMDFAEVVAKLRKPFEREKGKVETL